MKNTTKILVLSFTAMTLLSSKIFAQWSGTSGNVTTSSGVSTITVGSSTPGSGSSEKFNVVDGNISLYQSTDGNARWLCGHTSTGSLDIGTSTNLTGPYMEMWGGTNSTKPGRFGFVAYKHTAGDMGFDFLSYDPSASTWTSLVKIYHGGQVLIGNDGVAIPAGYRLFVQDGILTERVRVALIGTGDWADYVFNKDYKLMPMENLASYIQQNKHLPDVPSAQEVKDQGIDVAKMDAKLLQKIEELTLYVLQQQKEIDELKRQLK